MIQTIILIVMMMPAHAGFFANVCSRLIMDNPYVHEDACVEWVAKHYDRLCTASLWRKLSKLEQSELAILRGELQRRQTLGPDHDREVADITLIRCAK